MSSDSYIKFTEVFPDRLKSMRHEKKWTQKDLAAFLDVGRDLIIKWENGRSLPSDDQIGMLCIVSGYDYGYFKGEYDSKKKFSPELALRSGMSTAAADELLIMADQKDYRLEILSMLIENKKLLNSIDVATRATYQDGYIERADREDGYVTSPAKKRYYITAKMLYAADKVTAQTELMNFIDEVRKERGLDPL